MLFIIYIVLLKADIEDCSADVHLLHSCEYPCNTDCGRENNFQAFPQYSSITAAFGHIVQGYLVRLRLPWKPGAEWATEKESGHIRLFFLYIECRCHAIRLITEPVIKIPSITMVTITSIKVKPVLFPATDLSFNFIFLYIWCISRISSSVCYKLYILRTHCGLPN